MVVSDLPDASVCIPESTTEVGQETGFKQIHFKLESAFKVKSALPTHRLYLNSYSFSLNLFVFQGITSP